MLASTQENISNKPPCQFYMQGKCKDGKRGTICSFPHPNMCFCFIRQGKKGCNKGASCQYAHPTLCQTSLPRKRCDRRNCYYYHVAGNPSPIDSCWTNTTQHKNDFVPLQKHVSSQPTPLMQADVTPPSNPLPSTHRHNFIPEYAFSNLHPNSQVFVPRGLSDHSPSNEPTIV